MVYPCFQALAQLYTDSTSPAGAVLLYFAKVLIVSFGMRWIWFSNILDMGKIFVAGSRSSFRTLCPLSCLMGGRWIHLNWVQEFVKGTHYRQRCLCSLLSHSLFFLRTKMQGLGLQCGSSSHSVIIFADVCTGLLHDLRHTKEFLGYVDEYCLATGMRLNKTKTVVLPFRPWSTSSEPLRLEL